ncbi:MAG: LOG family protein [Candidatus Neomarinimicrobiota bacterium]
MSSPLIDATGWNQYVAATMSDNKRQREKFYEDLDFLNSPEARPARLLAEYFGPMRLFRKMRIKDTIVFFGSARIPSPEKADSMKKENPAEDGGLLSLVPYYQAARDLAFRLTKWSKGLKNSKHRFIVTSGGGGGIMEAACRGANEANGYAIGLNISLPREPRGNPYTTRELDLEFHYFFMRKYWFLYLAKAMIIFPGGFGTLDELMELLTLIQTGKIRKKLPVVIYGKKYWDKIIDLDQLVNSGTVSPDDLDLFHFSESVDDAFGFLTHKLTKTHLDGKNF